MPRTRPIKVNTTPESPAAPSRSVTIDIDENIEEKEKDAEELKTQEAENGQEVEIQEETQEDQEKEVVVDEEKVALRKQLADLRKSEETLRTTLDAERAEALRQAQQHQTETVKYRTDTERAQLGAITNALEANRADADKAQADYERALEASDMKAAADAHRRMSKAEAQIVQLEQGKEILESQIQMAEERVKQAPQRPSDPFEASIAQLPDTAKDWLRNHREYMTDQRKNAKIQALHWDVLDEGHKAFTPGYFESLETHLGMREKPEPKKTVEETEQRRAPTVSAPVTRDVPSVTTGKPSQTRVILTPEQREAAWFSMPDKTKAEAERIYAQNLLKLQAHKQNGHYSENR